MTTAILKVEQSGVDHSASSTVGLRLKMYLDQASIPLEDIGVFVYEVMAHGTGNISVFIGVASPSDMSNLVAGEPPIPVIGERFRMEEVDLLFRSKIHVDETIKLITGDIKEYFRLKAAINTVPLVPFVVVIT